MPRLTYNLMGTSLEDLSQVDLTDIAEESFDFDDFRERLEEAIMEEYDDLIDFSVDTGGFEWDDGEESELEAFWASYREANPDAVGT